MIETLAEHQKPKSKKIEMENIELSLLLMSDSKEQQKRIINEQIKLVGFKEKQQLALKFLQATREKYITNQKLSERGLKLLLSDIEKINLLMKECQVSSPISESLNHVFIDYLAMAQLQNLITNAELMNLWLVIPAHVFQSFLDKLNLNQEFKGQNSLKISENLTGLIQGNKLLQCCVYYMFSNRFPEFEDKILVPKLVATDQIFSPAIIELFRRIPELKAKVVNLITPAKALIIIQHLQQNPKQYPQIYQFILRKHYKSVLHQYPYWQIFEDKMSFNPSFLQWYCDEQQLPADVKQSIRFRNGLGGKQQKVANPLFTYDGFKPTQLILVQCQLYEKIGNDNKYVHLAEYGIDEKDVHFIDDSNTLEFDEMVQDVLSCLCIGFDVQYRCTSTKYEQFGASIIQISTSKQIYLIDFIRMESDNKFILFFQKVLKNQKIMKLGHSVQSDIRIIEKTMKIQEKEGIVDIATLFKKNFQNQNQSSLAFMTHYLTGKQLSKYEQRSNWNRRPLKKSQIHYAALDAQICIVLYQMMKQKKVSDVEIRTTNKKIEGINAIRKGNIVMREGQDKLLDRQIPKFVVDSMLKKLCSLLRNLGIDAEYVAVSNYELLEQIASKQDRVILTKDKKLLAKKLPLMPIYCIAERGDSDLMLQEIKRQFNINFSKFKTLSRCVKCNCSELEIITREEAFKYIKFQYEDNNQIEEFWRCEKCKQIYWEGNQFKNAKKRFGNM